MHNISNAAYSSFTRLMMMRRFRIEQAFRRVKGESHDQALPGNIDGTQLKAGAGIGVLAQSGIRGNTGGMSSEKRRRC